LAVGFEKRIYSAQYTARSKIPNSFNCDDFCF